MRTPLLILCLLMVGCAAPAKVTSVVNTDPATNHTSQTTIIEYKDWLAQVEDTLAQNVWRGVKYVGGLIP